MKKNIHPNYQDVLFIDSSTGEEFICGTTLKSKERRVSKTDGKEYPVFHVSVSSKSHPFYVGGKLMDTEGRIEKFNQRYNRTQK